MKNSQVKAVTPTSFNASMRRMRRPISALQTRGAWDATGNSVGSVTVSKHAILPQAENESAAVYGYLPARRLRTENAASPQISGPSSASTPCVFFTHSQQAWWSR